MYFIVRNTPYIDDLNHFITTDTTAAIKDKKNKELLYFKNFGKIEHLSSIFQACFWLLIVAMTIIFYQNAIVRV